MDYVPAHGDTAKRDDREDISGARCFDGEDQGKSQHVSIADFAFEEILKLLWPIWNSI